MLPGDVAVSIGTSGVVSAVSAAPTMDPSGLVAGFADAQGGYLPLACTLNGARVLDAAATMLGVTHAELSQLALAAPPGAEGLVMVPYLEGERTPNKPNARGTIRGLSVGNATRENFARAAVEGLLCLLADAMDALRAQDIACDRVQLIGGGAASEAVRQIAPAVLGMPVTVPPAGEYVADGAARQAAAVLLGELPVWSPMGVQQFEAAPTPEVRAAYATARDQSS
jgi:xylulokinase